MRLSKAKQGELETLYYFIPHVLKNIKITQADINKYFEWSESGLHKKDIKLSGFTDGFNVLVSAKSWRGIHIHEMYEDGVLTGDMPYWVILGGDSIAIRRKWFHFWKPKYTFKHDPPPRSVVDFMKKEMFKGKDADLIETIYQNILKYE